ncbi:MAG: response regulator [Anaeromyxobacteraceae bacterium]
MSHHDEELRALERRLSLLEEENSSLTEGHEDALLLGLVAEQIHALKERGPILRAGLERISMLKDIPLCACLSLGGTEATILEHFTSFSDAPPMRPSLTLSGRLPEHLAVASRLLEGPACADSGLGAAFRFAPAAVLLIPFRSRAVPEGAFLFADDRGAARLRRSEIFLHRLVELVVARLDNCTLLEELGLLADELDRKVRERTRELAQRNLALERAIEEHRETEVALRESEERFRLAFMTSPDAVNVTRLADGVYVAVNDGFTRLTGWTADDVVGHPAVELGVWVDPTDRDRLVNGLRAAGRVENLEAQFRGKDGRIVTGLMSAALIQLAGEACVLSITRDIGAIKQAQAERDRLAAQLRQAQKMEAIGRLAGGVAHDFNNLLTVILTCSSELKAAAARGLAPNVEDVEAIHAAGERARDLTRQLLAFARKQVIAPVALDLGEVVKKAEKLLRRVLGEDVELSVSTVPGVWPVHADPGQLEQVLMNLAVNARDAMPGGGRLAIAVRNVEAHEADARQRHGAWVALAVRDTGTGMAPEVKEHLFEPFFTTKGPGAGTGLGLATVYGIVDQAGGHISVDSTPGRGTTFEIRFPRTGSPTPAPVAENPLANPRRGTETVLVVEDDALVRSLTVRVLRGAGYQVLVASQGQEAIELARGGRLDLVVTDVVLPGVGGRDVAQALRSARPGLPVLYVSGYTADAIATRGVLAPGVEFLAKPFTARALLERVRAILDAAARG